jgi:CBS domain containing-hemolysin-like protein
MVALEVTATHKDLITRLIADGYSRFPIFEGNRDRVIGILHAKDVLRSTNDNTFSLREHLHAPLFVPESKPLQSLLREMQLKKAQMAIVVDEYGSTAGIVTMEDIIEELVGEIQDEYDEEPPLVQKVNEAEYIVDASASISDVNQLLPVPIPENPEWNSLGGLLAKLGDGVPRKDQVFQFGNYSMATLESTPKSVGRVRLRLALTEA